jgi:hypothetical protein
MVRMRHMHYFSSTQTVKIACVGNREGGLSLLFTELPRETVWKIGLRVWITWLLVTQSGNKGASRLVLASSKTPE